MLVQICTKETELGYVWSVQLMTSEAYKHLSKCILLSIGIDFKFEIRYGELQYFNAMFLFTKDLYVRLVYTIFLHLLYLPQQSYV